MNGLNTEVVHRIHFCPCRKQCFDYFDTPFKGCHVNGLPLKIINCIHFRSCRKQDFDRVNMSLHCRPMNWL